MNNHRQPDVEYCRVLKQRAETCWDEHHARYGSLTGTPLYTQLRDRIRTSSSTCFRLAARVVRECHQGASFGRR